MADLGNYYERAFLDYVCRRQLCCMGMNESHRAYDRVRTLKSLDFILHAGRGRKLLVDVKGRRISDKRPQLETWATQDDVESLLRWESIFSDRSIGLLVFVYHLCDVDEGSRFPDVFTHTQRRFGCWTVSAASYRTTARLRSKRWGTVYLPKAAFEMVRRPLQHWLPPSDEWPR